ncbi:MAG: CIA30 family protein [Flavobacteriales bacterium]|nr:CIA30 family protein [Flavobacteriales bacterium]
MNNPALNWLVACVFSFGSQEGGLEGWATVDDRVMGGVSKSKVVAIDSALHWEGELSLESNGGFVSVRSPWNRGQLGKARKVVMKARGSQGVYALRLASSQVYYEPSHQAFFEVDETSWTTFSWSMEEFETTVLGRATGGNLDVSKVEDVGRVGVMKSDGNPGAFWLEIDFIRFE